MIRFFCLRRLSRYFSLSGKLELPLLCLERLVALRNVDHHGIEIDQITHHCAVIIIKSSKLWSNTTGKMSSACSGFFSINLSRFILGCFSSSVFCFFYDKEANFSTFFNTEVYVNSFKLWCYSVFELYILKVVNCDFYLIKENVFILLCQMKKDTLFCADKYTEVHGVIEY